MDISKHFLAIPATPKRSSNSNTLTNFIDSKVYHNQSLINDSRGDPFKLKIYYEYFRHLQKLIIISDADLNVITCNLNNNSNLKILRLLANRLT